MLVVSVSVLFWSKGKRVEQDTDYNETVKPFIYDYFDAELANTTFLSHAMQTWDWVQVLHIVNYEDTVELLQYMKV